MFSACYISISPVLAHFSCWAPLKQQLALDTFAALPIPILTTNRQYYMSSWRIAASCGCVRLRVCSSALHHHAKVILLGCQMHSYFNFSCFYLVKPSPDCVSRPVRANSALSEENWWYAASYRCPLCWTCYAQLMLMKSLYNVCYLSDRNSLHTTAACLPCLGLTGSQGAFLGGNMWCDPARSSPIWVLHKSCQMRGNPITACHGKIA